MLRRCQGWLHFGDVLDFQNLIIFSYLTVWMRVSGHFANVFIWGDKFCNSPNILMWTTSTCHRSLINQASAYHLVFTGSPVCGAEGLRGGWMWSNSPGNWFHTGGASCDHWLRRGCAFLQRGLRLTGSLWADNWSKRGKEPTAIITEQERKK